MEGIYNQHGGEIESVLGTCYFMKKKLDKISAV